MNAQYRQVATLAFFAGTVPHALSWLSPSNGVDVVRGFNQRVCPTGSGTKYSTARRRLCGALDGKVEAAVEAEMVAVRAMKVSEIKKALAHMKISSAGLFERFSKVVVSVGSHDAAEATPRRLLKANEKEELAYLLALERVRQRGANGSNGKFHGGGPPPESWTEAKWGSAPQASRITDDGAAVVPMVRIRPSETVLGEDIRVDQKDYYCIELDLPQAPSGPTRGLFMLDTAATNSIITPKASRQLGAVKTGISAMAMAGTEGISGLSLVDIGEIRLAGRTYGKLKPVVMELPITDIRATTPGGETHGVSGILGMDFLRRFDVKLDFQSGEVVFAQPGTAANGGLGAGGMTGVDGSHLPAGVVVVNIKMSRARAEGRAPVALVPAVVDLGSAVTICNWAAGRAAGIKPNDPVVHYNGEVGQIEMDLMLGTGPRSPGGVDGRGALIRSKDVSIGDLPGLQALRRGQPLMVLGSDVFKLGNGAMIISSHSTKIWLDL